MRYGEIFYEPNVSEMSHDISNNECISDLFSYGIGNRQRIEPHRKPFFALPQVITSISELRNADKKYIPLHAARRGIFKDFTSIPLVFSRYRKDHLQD